MSYMGSALPTGIIPLSTFAQPLRDKSGRLTEWGVALMTAAQNVAIAAYQRSAGRTATRDEKLRIIADVQRKFGQSPRFQEPLPVIPASVAVRIANAIAPVLRTIDQSLAGTATATKQLIEAGAKAGATSMAASSFGLAAAGLVALLIFVGRR